MKSSKAAIILLSIIWGICIIFMAFTFLLFLGIVIALNSESPAPIIAALGLPYYLVSVGITIFLHIADLIYVITYQIGYM